ncbi:MAG: hypothetical protein R2883_02840 [Caldisericia bacterium]
MFKNKMNAYGFILVVLVWIVFVVLNFFGIGNVAIATQYLFSLLAFLFFILAYNENKGFAIAGLAVTLLSTTGLGGIENAGIGIAYLFFAFALIKSESATLNLLAWAMILSFLLMGVFGFWNVPVLEGIFTGIANILVGALLVYYLATEAGINLPGNLDEQVKEKLG